MKLERVWWGLGMLFAIAAVVICLIPGNDVEVFEVNDKLSHLSGHALLAMYFAGLVPRARWWKIFVSLALLGIAIELAQYFMHAGREADPYDVVANCCGALLGLVIARLGVDRWPQWAAKVLGARAPT